MKTLIFRIAVGVVLCVIAPWAGVNLVVHYMDISWFNIFMVSGMESLWVYLCWDISRWIKEAWYGK